MGCAHSSRVRPNGVQSLDTTWARNGYSLPQLMKVLRAKIGVVSALALVGAGALCATAFGTVSSLGGASPGATSSIDGDALDARASLGQAASGAGVVDDRAAGLGDAWADRFGKLNEEEIKALEAFRDGDTDGVRFDPFISFILIFIFISFL